MSFLLEMIIALGTFLIVNQCVRRRTFRKWTGLLVCMGGCGLMFIPHPYRLNESVQGVAFYSAIFGYSVFHSRSKFETGDG